MNDHRPSTNPAIGWTDEHGTYHHAPGYGPCTCGSPDTYSLNPAEVVIHRRDALPCYITSAEGASDD